jgi:hypothetical protein
MDILSCLTGGLRGAREEALKYTMALTMKDGVYEWAGDNHGFTLLTGECPLISEAMDQPFLPGESFPTDVGYDRIILTNMLNIYVRTPDKCTVRIRMHSSNEPYPVSDLLVIADAIEVDAGLRVKRGRSCMGGGMAAPLSMLSPTGLCKLLDDRTTARQKNHVPQRAS